MAFNWVNIGRFFSFTEPRVATLLIRDAQMAVRVKLSWKLA